MKKAASILLVLAMILTYVTAFAGDPWYCPDCGQKNESNFCSNCGAKRPDGSSGGSSSTGGMVFEKISANSDGSVVISWSGGQAPYKLQYEWFVSDNYNLGTDVTRWNAEENLYNTSVTLKYDLVPGERYWIIVTDANGNSVWEDYHPKKETFTKISGANMVFSLRTKRNKRSSTVQSFTANEIEREYLSVSYGATIKMNLGTRKQSLACTARMVLFLPNGEPILFHVEDCDIPGWMTAPGWLDYYWDSLWPTIMECKGTIPAGRYTFRLYLDNGLFGQQDFGIN